MTMSGSSIEVTTGWLDAKVQAGVNLCASYHRAHPEAADLLGVWDVKEFVSDELKVLEIPLPGTEAPGCSPPYFGRARTAESPYTGTDVEEFIDWLKNKQHGSCVTLGLCSGTFGVVVENQHCVLFYDSHSRNKEFGSEPNILLGQGFMRRIKYEELKLQMEKSANKDMSEWSVFGAIHVKGRVAAPIKMLVSSPSTSHSLPPPVSVDSVEGSFSAAVPPLLATSPEEGTYQLWSCVTLFKIHRPWFVLCAVAIIVLLPLCIPVIIRWLLSHHRYHAPDIRTCFLLGMWSTIRYHAQDRLVFLPSGWGRNVFPCWSALR